LDDFAIIEGGPMMGCIIDIDEPVKKTTSGFLVFPKEHPLIVNRLTSINYILRIAASACMQCRACTDLCPRYLLGHPIEPHKIMRSTAMPLSLPVETMTAAMLCSECGICELFACPMRLSPRRINRELKERFAAQSIRFKCDDDEFIPREEREYRRIPSRRLAERLGILDYIDIHPQFIPIFPISSKVRLPLKQNMGVPAIPLVIVGDDVKKSQKIADIPKGELGAPLHAPIDGKIISIEPDIVIESAN
ncbi:hypothetical protein DRQ33_08715, partial [bacterium]